MKIASGFGTSKYCRGGKLVVLLFFQLVVVFLFHGRFASGEVLTDTNIQSAVQLWQINQTEAEELYKRPIEQWDTSLLTNLHNAFWGAENFAVDLSAWDVTRVKDMFGAFAHTTNFAADLSTWDLSQVTSMHFTFVNSVNFAAQGVANWNTSLVNTMEHAFAESKNFVADLSKWNVSSVTKMENIFKGSKNFQADVSKWNTGRVISMASAWELSQDFKADVSGWNFSSVTSMKDMFRGSTSFSSSDMSSWNTSSVIDFSGIFYDASWGPNHITGVCWDLTSADPELLTEFSCYGEGGFDCGCASLDQQEEDEEAAKDTYCKIINSGCPNPAPPCIIVAYGNVESPKNFCSENDDDVEDQEDEESSSSGTIASGDNNLPSVEEEKNEEEKNEEDTKENETKEEETTEKEEEETTEKEAEEEEEISENEEEKDTTTSTVESDEEEKMSDSEDDIATEALTDDNLRAAILLWVADQEAAEQLYGGPIEQWDTSNVTSLRNAFWGAKSFVADLSKWDTSKVVDMFGTFAHTENFAADISTWDLTSVTSMHFTFVNSENFASHISTWQLSSLGEMEHTFAQSKNFTSDISTWDVSSVTNMRSTFESSSNLVSDVSKWKTTSVQDFTHTFYDAFWFESKLCWDLSSVPEDMVVSLSEMFCFSKGGFDCSCNSLDSSSSLCKVINSQCPDPTPPCIVANPENNDDDASKTTKSPNFCAAPALPSGSLSGGRYGKILLLSVLVGCAILLSVSWRRVRILFYHLKQGQMKSMELVAMSEAGFEDNPRVHAVEMPGDPTKTTKNRKGGTRYEAVDQSFL